MCDAHAGDAYMTPTYDTQVPKKPTNINVNSDLLAKAIMLGIDLSTTLETALSELVNAKQRDLWKRENKAAIEAYNQLVKEHRIFSDDLRSF